jgi:hypothetical protein
LPFGFRIRDHIPTSFWRGRTIDCGRSEDSKVHNHVHGSRDDALAGSATGHPKCMHVPRPASATRFQLPPYPLPLRLTRPGANLMLGYQVLFYSTVLLFIPPKYNNKTYTTYKRTSPPLNSRLPIPHLSSKETPSHLHTTSRRNDEHHPGHRG